MQTIKEITGWNTPEEWCAYEKGRQDEADVIEEWIKNWDGTTNSAIGSLLIEKFKQLKEKENE